MALSRRKFTKEVKVAAIQRLDAGASAAEVARAFEIRAGFYRFDSEREPWDEDLDLRDEIQRIALEFPFYGRPRITPELKRRGWEVGHRRVGRPHAGIIVALQQRYSVGEKLRRLLRLIGTVSVDDMRNRIEFLSAWL